jgi:hypothetical protein
MRLHAGQACGVFPNFQYNILILQNKLKKSFLWHAPRIKRIILPLKTEIYKRRFRDGNLEPLFAWCDGASRATDQAPGRPEPARARRSGKQRPARAHKKRPRLPAAF